MPSVIWVIVYMHYWTYTVTTDFYMILFR